MATQRHHLTGWDVWHYQLAFDFRRGEDDPPPLPYATPSHILNKYIGTFRCAATAKEQEEGIEAKEVNIEIRSQMLYLVQGFVIKKPVEVKEIEVTKSTKSKKGANTTAKGKAVQSGRVTKKTAAPKPQVKPNSVAAAMANSPALRRVTATPQTSTSSAASTSTPAASPAPAITSTQLFLNINGVPKFRIRGATKEEDELNAEIQGVGRLGPGGVLVSFDVKMGEVRGVRVGGEMFVRVSEEWEGGRS